MKEPSRLEALRRPEHLSGAARRYWDDVAPILWKKGHLNSETRSQVIEGAEWHGRLVELYQLSEEHLDTIEDENGCTVLRPEYREKMILLTKFQDFSHNFGLTPLGRTLMEERGGTIGTRETDLREECPDLFGEE